MTVSSAISIQRIVIQVSKNRQDVERSPGGHAQGASNDDRVQQEEYSDGEDTRRPSRTPAPQQANRHLLEA